MDGHIIELEQITVRKGAARQLDSVSLRVAAGEFVGIVGPNGAGKTTLLNVIAGFERFEGSLTLFGRRESWRRGRAVRLRIGYVPQQFDIDPAFPISAAEAVMTGAVGRTGLFRSFGKHEEERTRQLLEMMRIGHCAQRPLGLLSGGERQKVSLARAMLQQPEVLLLDEPTAGLDIAVQKEFLDTLGEVHRREGLTLLFVTHDFNMLPAGMRRAVLLGGGRVVFDGGVETAMSGGSLSKLFGYPLETFERHGRRFVSYD
jgi:ABC-type Mn2+/Zn2+ transport system ATPase subunit